MKLIATKDFFNSKQLGVKIDEKAEGFVHKDMIHKGARFSIGSGEIYSELQPTEREHVGTLLKRRLAVMDATENKAVIDKIDKEAEAERAAAKKAFAKHPPLEELIATAAAAAVTNALIAAGVIKPAKAA